MGHACDKPNTSIVLTRSVLPTVLGRRLFTPHSTDEATEAGGGGERNCLGLPSAVRSCSALGTVAERGGQRRNPGFPVRCKRTCPFRCQLGRGPEWRDGGVSVHSRDSGFGHVHAACSTRGRGCKTCRSPWWNWCTASLAPKA